MGSYGHAQILGFSEDVQKAVGKEADALEKKGINSEKIHGEIQEQHEEVASLNAQQESLKRQLKATTAAYMAARVKLYFTCSGALDTVMAAVEKNSAAAKNLQRLRSRIRRPKGALGAVTLPVPSPPA